MFVLDLLKNSKKIISTEVHNYKLKGDDMKSVCINWDILKAKKD